MKTFKPQIMDNSNRKQFVYKREVEVPPIKEDTEKGIIGADGYTKIVFDSFNIDCVIRSITMDDGKILLLLDDLHTRYETKPKINPRTNRPRTDKKGQIMLERVEETFQSEIMLSEEEGKQFYELTSINDYEETTSTG